MKLYLTRNILKEGIVEAEGRRLTGHENKFQVNGKGVGSSRIYHSDECFTTRKEAEKRAVQTFQSQINCLESDLKDYLEAEKHIKEITNKIKTYKALIASLSQESDHASR